MKWYKSEDFKYDKFQSYYDHEHDFGNGNYKNSCEQAFETAWDYQQKQIEKLVKDKVNDDKYLDNIDNEIKKLKDENKRLRGYMKNAISPEYLCNKCGFREITFRSINRCCRCDSSQLHKVV